LKTKQDYLWFIGEMENAARFFSRDVKFINSTVHGALLRGWLHKPLDEHPLLVEDSAKRQPKLPALPAMTADELRSRSDAILSATELEQDDIERAAQLCSELVAELRSLVAAGSKDVTKLVSLESSLEHFLRKKGSILRFYTSRFSMALAAAAKSVESLEENLSISAEYYHQVGSRAKHLASMLADAHAGLELVSNFGVIEDGG
jgi:hypothetical protein